MIKLEIDNQPVEVEEGTTILQACEQQGVEIPVFCYHPKLSIAGNCRMCLVEVEGGKKPVASCSMPAQEGMKIKTNSDMVIKARKGVLEFLLINHPLDCPICDQGGECDLQDITKGYGRGTSRFELNKRAVSEKYMGPLIKTVMTRCIHCTRCVRFGREIAGTRELATFGRGELTEIASYLESAVRSELSGNMVDICPVGALTNKPYAFHGRPWELTKTETIDVMDASCSSIRIDTKGQTVMRVLPRLNEEINEEWINDKTRHSYDGLMRQRLDRPYIRIDGKLRECTWDKALSVIHEKLVALKGTEIAAIVGDQADVEAIFSLKLLMHAFGSPHTECRQDGMKISSEARGNYIFNTTIAGVEDADLCLIIGSNPRHESTAVNTRIRKRYLWGDFTIGLVGEAVDLTYPYEHLGNHVSTLKEILSGAHAFCEKLKAAKKPMMIVGTGALNRRDSLEILKLLQDICEKYGLIKDGWNGFNVLNRVASRVGAMDLGFTPGKNGKDLDGIFSAAKDGSIKAIYLLAADEFDMAQLGDAFVIYQGHHGDAGAHRADVILPGAVFTEKEATFVNLEGRVQQTNPALAPPGEAREDWKIIRALSGYFGTALPFNNLTELRQVLMQNYPVFERLDQITPAPWYKVKSGAIESLSQKDFTLPIANFYMTDPISRHSEIMAACMREDSEPLNSAYTALGERLNHG